MIFNTCATPGADIEVAWPTVSFVANEGIATYCRLELD